MDSFDRKYARVDSFGAGDSNHFGRNIQGEYLPSESLEVNRVLSASASEIENAISALDQRIQVTPNGVSLQSAGL
jgi:hypothetical protein